MKIVKVHKVRELLSIKHEIIEIVKRGGLIIYPTDTVYGLGCDPFNLHAVRKIYEAKRRSGKPLPVLVSSVDEAKRVACLNQKALALIKQFWPGPLTLIVKKRENVPYIVTAGRDTIGVRMPNHEIALSLIGIVGGVFIGTSANISGKAPPKTAREAIMQLSHYVDLVIDSGTTLLGLPSTCIDLTTEPPTIVREGPIGRERIQRIIGDVK